MNIKEMVNEIRRIIAKCDAPEEARQFCAFIYKQIRVLNGSHS